MKKLFLVHCGFYDATWGANTFENHTNFFVVAESAAEARQLVKNKSEVQKLRMHVDGLLEIQQIDGYKIDLQPAENQDSLIIPHMHRDLAPSNQQKPLA